MTWLLGTFAPTRLLLTVTELGAAGLVMAIIGGTLSPLLHGFIADLSDTDVGHLVAVGCLAVVGAHALHDVRSAQSAETGAFTSH